MVISYREDTRALTCENISQVTAFMLSTAAAAMITVSIVDLFMHIAEEIG